MDSPGSENGTKPSDFDPSLPDNIAESDAASDAAKEQKSTGNLDMDKPDWADDMPDPGGGKDK